MKCIFQKQREKEDRVAAIQILFLSLMSLCALLLIIAIGGGTVTKEKTLSAAKVIAKRT